MLWYGIEPPELPHYCDRCNATFTIWHSLDYKRGSLITARHNMLCDGVADLSGKAFTPSHVCNDPLIFAGCAVKRPKSNPARSKSKTVTSATPLLEATEKKGELLISVLWMNVTDSVHNIRVVNTYTKSYLVKTPGKCLKEAEWAKRKMCLETCLQQRQ